MPMEPRYKNNQINNMKKNLFQLMTILTVAILSVSFVSCSDDDENTDSVPIPSNLIGTWYKTSGATKHSMSFTFNEDGTGSGNSSHNKNHKKIDYEMKNNCCNNHGDRFILYCKDCNKDLLRFSEIPLASSP